MMKKQSKLKGYFLTIVCGLVVIAGTLFLILQWPDHLTAKVSIYGGEIIPPVKTIWVIAFSALLGPVFLLCCWWLLRGVWILYTIRRDEARQVKAAGAVLAKARKQADAASPKAESPAAPEAPEAPTDEPAGESTPEPADESAEAPAPEPAADGDAPV